MNLESIKPAPGARKSRKRIGRGEGSGHGGTSTKGHKGQKARAGGLKRPGFEGGQMPLIRRIPKRGFINPFRREFAVINVGELNELPAGTVVDAVLLSERGHLKKAKDGLKILGNGDLAVALTVKADRFSVSARQKIEAAGGKAELTERHG